MFKDSLIAYPATGAILTSFPQQAGAHKYNYSHRKGRNLKFGGNIWYLILLSATETFAHSKNQTCATLEPISLRAALTQPGVQQESKGAPGDTSTTSKRSQHSRKTFQSEIPARKSKETARRALKATLPWLMDFPPHRPIPPPPPQCSAQGFAGAPVDLSPSAARTSLSPRPLLGCSHSQHLQLEPSSQTGPPGGLQPLFPVLGWPGDVPCGDKPCGSTRSIQTPSACSPLGRWECRAASGHITEALPTQTPSPFPAFLLLYLPSKDLATPVQLGVS